MALHPFDIIALVAYFLLVASLGVWTARRVTTLEDFVMPRRFGKTMMLFFSFGSGTHSDQAVSVAAKTYVNGASGIWYQWLWLFVTPFYWLIAPMMRRFRALTTADVFELRFGPSVAILYAVVGLLQYSVNIGVMLKGSSHVIEASTGGLVSAEWAIPLMTLMFVAYGVAGGLHAAVLTDLVQGILTVIFSFLLLPFVLAAIGGLSGLREALPAEKLSLVAPEGIDAFYIMAISFNALVGIVAQPHTMANCAAGKMELDGQIGFMGGSLLKRVCTIAWTVTGLAAIVYFQQQGRDDLHPDEVFGTVAHDFLPQVLPGLLGLFIAGLLASVMSSCDAFMIATSGLFTANLYKPLVPGKSPRHYLWVARGSSVIVVGLGVAFAYRLESVVDGLEVFWKVASLLGIAFWLGLFWRGMTTMGAWASTLTAILFAVLTEQAWFSSFLAKVPGLETAGVITHLDGGVAMPLPWQMVVYLTTAVGVGVVVSWFTPKIPPERLDRFYGLLRTPVKEGEQIASPCQLPAGVVPPQARKLIDHSSLEIPRPTVNALIGFAAGCLSAALLIGVFVFLLN